ncbi:hypothetical protein NMY22_g10848 [Coprinellus aureogranulatus]|nr:hypothetical protein NMY22_g10848 [Coprinellus aureogranulatus]
MNAWDNHDPLPPTGRVGPSGTASGFRHFPSPASSSTTNCKSRLSRFLSLSKYHNDRYDYEMEKLQY